MFDDNSQYSKERIKTFFKYLVYAASKSNKQSSRVEKINRIEPSIYSSENVKKIFKPIEESKIMQRLDVIGESRREQLELKINMHYTQNRYLPFELRLKKLRNRYNRLKKSKNKSKTKVEYLKIKIKSCEKLLSTVKKADASRYNRLI